jgi:hypothetical protein
MSCNSKKIAKIEVVSIICVFLCLILIPILFWGSDYFVGGDDGRLYYLYPYEYFKNFTTSIISENNIGGLGFYFPQTYILPFSFLIYIVKTVSFGIVNIQYLMLSLNLFFGFLGMYLLLGIFIKTTNLQNIFIKITSSLMYIFSTFTFISGWGNQLFAIYFISIFPIVLYLFSKGVIENKYIYTLLSTIILSIFSILILSVPWALALIITSLPVIIYLIKKDYKIFLKHLFIFIIIVLLLNMYWIYHLLNSRNNDIKDNDIVNSLTSQDFIEANKNTIISVSKNNNVLYPLLNLPHYSIQKDFAWNTLSIYEGWHLKFFNFNYIYLIIILIPIIFFRDKIKKHTIYIYSLLIFLIILYLYTANIGKEGINIFIFLSEKMPLFTLFRNMYDKFAISMAFIYAFLFAISLYIIADLKVFYKNIFYFIFILVILLNAIPFIRGDYFKLPIWTTQNIYPKVNELNNDFIDLSNFIKENEDNNGKYLWYPLNKANYVFIQDESNKNGFYFGVSPLKVVSNKTDFTGILGFSSQGENIGDKILNKDDEHLLNFFATMNVNYIIVYNDLPTEIKNSYVYSYRSSGDLYAVQQEIKDKLLGDKVRDFGRYSIYNINKDYSYNKIHLSDNLNELSREYNDNITYERINEGHYKIDIKNLNSNKYLNFLDPYHKMWRLSNDDINYNAFKNTQSFDYANSFYINYDELIKNNKGYTLNSDGSINLELDLIFEPIKYNNILYVISGSTLVLCLGYIGYSLIRKKRMG